MAIAAIRDHAKRFGLAKTGAELTHRLINQCATYVGLEAMTLTMETVDQSYLDDDDSLTYRFLTEAELRAQADAGDMEMTHAILDDVLGKGDRCFGCLDGEELASYGWYGSEPSAITDDLIIEFERDWTYMSKGYTRPTHRGRRLHAIGMACALRAVASEGSRGLISVVETTNFASLRSCERLGYQIFGRVRAIKLFGRYLIRDAGTRAQHGFVLRPRRPSDPPIPPIRQR